MSISLFGYLTQSSLI